MSTAIRIEKSSRVVFHNVGIRGFDVGIDIADSNDVNISGSSFEDVGTGVRADGVVNLKASNNRFLSDKMDNRVVLPTGKVARLSVPAILVRQYLNSL